MDFFSHQDKAQKNTGKLFGLMALAVVGILLAVNALVFFIVQYNATEPYTLAQYLRQPYWWMLSSGVFAIMLAKSVYRYYQLRGGGKVLAQQIGARRITANTKNSDERRLYNVVEEMSIASGLPMPALYVMDDEPGINAFVAGVTPQDAILVVTYGALTHFDRDELQGVIAHEFSHIFHGDMAINMKLMGVLSGITAISQVGSALARGSSRRYRSKDSNGGAWIGLGLLVIGFIGVLCARLIKAAISRQREFLADASAVQYTRNPEGIASALYTISKHAGGSTLDTSYSEELSHLCFGESGSASFAGWFATHPPLNTRIDVIDKYYRIKRSQKVAKEVEAKQAPSADVINKQHKVEEFAQLTQGLVIAASAMNQTVGTMPASAIKAAETVQHSLSELLDTARHEEVGAQAILYGLFLDENRSALSDVSAHLNKRVAPEIREQIKVLWNDVQNLFTPQRLPLVESCLATLKTLSSGDVGVLLSNLELIAKADGKYSYAEFVLFALIRAQLIQRSPVTTHYKSYKPVLGDIAVVMAALANLNEVQQSAYDTLMASFGKGFVPPDQATPESPKDLEYALANLNRLSPLLKGNLLDVFQECLSHDGQVDYKEYELLRAIGEMLDCPIPMAWNGAQSTT